jgi:hypothetical protein
MSSKFKVGDRVKIITKGHSQEGKVYKVREVFEERTFRAKHYALTDSSNVKHGDLFEIYFDKDLEYDRVKYTKLAEKIYPNGKREGDWWLL